MPKPHVHRHKTPNTGPFWFQHLVVFIEHFVGLRSPGVAEPLPADQALSQFFRDQPKLGKQDRHRIAESFYAWLRFRPRIQSLADALPGKQVERWAWLASMMVDEHWLLMPPPVFADVPLEPLLKQLKGEGVKALPELLQHCMPIDLWQRLLTQLGPVQAVSLADASNQAAPLDIRVNTLKAKPEEVIAALQPLLSEHQAVTSIPGLPGGLRLTGRPALQTLSAFKEGWFEVQDAGSQWAAMLCAPRRRDLVIDFCAGAGGKTLALGAAMRNTGQLIALDTAPGRLARLKPRLQRSGLSNVYAMAIDHAQDPRLQRYHGKADRVIVDAPCSGSGTLRRNPDLKWTWDGQQIPRLQAAQMDILRAAANLVKPDGRLIYITCSLLQEENEAMVEAFLQEHQHFRVRHWREVLAPAHRPTAIEVSELSVEESNHPYFRLWPHQHGTDGFFVAVMQRNA